MSYPHESTTSAPPAVPARRRHTRLALVVAAALATGAALAGWLLTDHSDISQQTAYDRVNKATQSLVTMLGQDPARHPTFASVSHCDNGAGGYSGWLVDGGSSLQAITPDQAVALGHRLEAALHRAGYSNVALAVDGPNVDVHGRGDNVGVYLHYRPSDTKDYLQFGATTDCNVTVGPHAADQDAGFPLTDDQGRLLPSPGTGTRT